MFSVLFACFLASSLGAVRTYNVVANSNTEWTLSGNTSGVNPILPMVQGDVITFVVAAPGHAFAIHQTAGNTNSNDRYTSGVSGSQGIANGVITFTVPNNVPNTLFYQCEIHSAMTGRMTANTASVLTVSVALFLFIAAML